MNLFPDLSVARVEAKEELPVFKEWAFDFEKQELKTRNGAYYLVEKEEALKVWIYKALKTSRYDFTAYSKKYGSEIETLFGFTQDEEIMNSELTRMVEEALLVNPYITGVDRFSFWRDDKRKRHMSFAVGTIYGEIEEDMEAGDGYI